jgi:hypothetical protein
MVHAVGACSRFAPPPLPAVVRDEAAARRAPLTADAGPAASKLRKMWAEFLQVLAKAGLGGVLVVVFAVFAETLSPKRFAGVFAAAPSVALASLLVTVLFKGARTAGSACTGMAAGAVGFVVYCLLVPGAMRRWGSLRGAGAALGGWLAVTAVTVPLAAAMLGGGKLAAAAAPGTAAAGASRRRPALHCQPGKVREAKPKDWLIRFLFGAGTSATAGVIALAAGPVIGGTLLAFPAILLASLTLVAEEDGRAQARDDARGATAGALGLIGFATVGAGTYGRIPTMAVFGLVTVAWAVAGFGAYAAAWATGAGADEPH